MKKSLLLGLLICFGSLAHAAKLIDAKVVQLIDEKDGLVLVLNRGSAFGVNVGSKVFISGKEVGTVTESKNFKSKAKTGMSYQNPGKVQVESSK
ncbi:MAG: hypothetical protein CMI09_03030 [Oceanospirillaceae bacterium]|nr:hypothetical protein [Oceanospirillaceae bacterium]